MAHRRLLYNREVKDSPTLSHAPKNLKGTIDGRMMNCGYTGDIINNFYIRLIYTGDIQLLVIYW